MAATLMGSHEEQKKEATVVYKTKVVQFLGRSVPIILQNDNGPCPLLAICNVLLLRNNVNLSTDIAEISLQRLLSLVAERLLDSNSNTENKDLEYVRNQQQNISDAIELLPRLATGLDVNVRFRNIHDFEFTPECAVFDLLDIGLVHGWLFDPQDEVTSSVIGANSYNTLVEKLVEFKTRKAEMEATGSEDFVDFVAATTATLGVPSPSREILSKTESFKEQEGQAIADGKQRKGDAEEAAQLLQALQFSTDGLSSSFTEASVQNHEDENADSWLHTMEQPTNNSDSGNRASELSKPDSTTAFADHASTKESTEGSYSALPDVFPECKDLTESFVDVSPEIEGHNDEYGSASVGCDDLVLQMVGGKGLQVGAGIESLSGNSNFGAHDVRTENSGLLENSQTSSLQELPDFDNEGLAVCPAKDEAEFLEIQTPYFPKKVQINASEISSLLEEKEHLGNGDRAVEKGMSVAETSTLESNSEVEDNASSSLESCEPLYEGESFLAEAQTCNFESREPLYEGEAVLAECSERAEPSENNPFAAETILEISKLRMEEENLSAAVTEGMVIENFLSSNASQLTYFGLFGLLEGLKERELCVFFRNNHFNAMFKYNGDLYLLATDQGYLAQQDLVWEKLNEVHGDSVFVTGNFTVFQADQTGGLWSERDAVAATAEYLSSHKKNDSGAQEPGFNSNYNSDLQLAMALQHQEFQQQQQQTRTESSASPHPHSRNGAVAAKADGSRLVTGPKRSSVPLKPDTKSKDKCVIM